MICKPLFKIFFFSLLNLRFPKHVAFILLLFTGITAFAQSPDMRLRRVDDSLVKMTHYENDSTANAVILGDKGRIHIKYCRNDGWQVEYNRHLRIKIFNRDAFDLADFRIPIYRGERLVTLRAYVFSPEEGGGVDRTRFRRRNAYEEEISNNLSYTVFALPNVREGSVIDLEYTINSPFLSFLPDWQFQSLYPKVFSELTVITPEYFDYNTLMQGFLQVTEHEQTTRRGQLVFQWVDRAGLHDTEPRTHTSRIDFREDINKYRIDNIPAFTLEPHMNSPVNYLSKIEHELVAYWPPQGARTDFGSTWAQINEQLMDSDSFGRQFNRAGFLSDEIELIKSKYSEPMERMIAAHNIVQSKMFWNGLNSLYSRDGLRRAWRNEEGNAADINLTLILLLKELGINASPVILSTRNNGIINPVQVMLSKYNYVIAHASIDGKEFLLDATEKDTPFYLLPERCINGQGRLIDGRVGRWVNLLAIQDNIVNKTINIQLEPCGSMHVNLTKLKDNYLKLEKIKEYKRFADEDEYMENFESENQGVELVSFSMENNDTWADPLICEYEFVIPEISTSPQEVIYINPFVTDRIESNPFRIEERLFPVDFVYPHKRHFEIIVEIPEGYEVEELPRGTSTNLSGRSAGFVSRYIVNENNIEITFEININKAVFLPDEYNDLRQLYSQIVEEQARQIVLKRL